MFHSIEIVCSVIPVVFRATKIISMSSGEFQETKLTALRITTWSPTAVITDIVDA